MRALRSTGIAHELVVVHDCEAALRYLFGDPGSGGHRGVRPGLVLCDGDLPGGSGLDLLRRIRGDATTRVVSVVMLGSSAHDSSQPAYTLGANSYVRKSLDPELFSEIASLLGSYWLTLNQAPPIGHHL